MIRRVALELTALGVPLALGYRINLASFSNAPVLKATDGRSITLLLHPDGSVGWRWDAS